MASTVSDYVVGLFRALGIGHVFGIPGAHILPVYDRLYDSEIIPVLTKHEQGAAFMAGGYAKAGGGIGACIATAGPGATNLVTGLANAFMDRTPILAVTGETPTYSFGKGALQESSGQGTSIDQGRLFEGVTRYHRIVERTDYLEQVLRRAYSILTSRNPGPVLLSFPYNILKEEVRSDLSFLDGTGARPICPSPAFDVSAAGRIPEFLHQAKRPVIVAGYGAVVSGAAKELAEISERYGIPVATSLRARGIVSETSGLSLGVLGITARDLAMKYIADEADLLILAGVGFGERTSYNWNRRLIVNKKIVWIDNDPGQLFKVLTPDLPVLGDVKAVLKHLGQLLDTDPPEVMENSVPAMRKRCGKPNMREEDFCLIKEFLARFSDCMNGEALVFDDNIIYMQNFMPVRHAERYFPNSGISSLGQAVPAAIGARLAAGRPTVAVLGDGGFQMCGMELMTAINYSVPVTVILLNNSSLGLVRKNQHYNYSSRYISCDFRNPDFELLARSFGANYFRIAAKDDIDPALSALDLTGGINLVEIVMNKNDFPAYSSGR